jgi:uncharacterized protein
LTAFIDTNIPMYAAGSEHAAKRRCLLLLQRIAAGEIDAVTDAEVFQEILHRYSAIGKLDDGCHLFDYFSKVVTSVLPIEMHDVSAARDLLLDFPRLSSRDAIHVAVMRRHDIRVIFSYDRHFDVVTGIERKEP